MRKQLRIRQITSPDIDSIRDCVIATFLFHEFGTRVFRLENRAGSVFIFPSVDDLKGTALILRVFIGGSDDE
jgi:hypothetical protein